MARLEWKQDRAFSCVDRGESVTHQTDYRTKLRDRIISSHFAGKLNSFNMALTPLPPPAILKCGGHILLNAYIIGSAEALPILCVRYFR